MADPEFDAIVIGSGFAGAVTACRLAQAGQRVCILERGRRYAGEDLPVYPTVENPNGDAPGDEGDRLQPDISRALWQLGNGLLDIRDLGDITVAQAAGYGGGSLVYANVHLRAPKEVFDESWPSEYRNGQLDDYYDLAAYMLDVRPLPNEVDLPKSQQLERAAESLHRSAQFFRTPLAVNFGKKGPNRFGRQQGVCDMGGDCCMGCPEQAKNSLDLNYLAVAEDAALKGESLTTVRTYAEAVGIEQGNDGQPFYRVEYVDHLLDRGTSDFVTGRYVFLCAGAVNSTELLLRSRKLPLEGLGLGSRYYANADEVATVFDCDEPQEADRGPTITAAMLYDREPEDHDPLARWTLRFREGGAEPRVGHLIRSQSGGSGNLVSRPILFSGSWKTRDAAGELVLTGVEAPFGENEPLLQGEGEFAQSASASIKKKHWLLFEDGGLPADLEPALGVFRSPLWLHRNAFRERDGLSRSSLAQKIGYAPLPFENLADLPAGLNRSALRDQLPRAHEVAQHLLRVSRRQRAPDWQLADAADDCPAWQLLPEQLEEALEKLKKRSLDEVGIAASPLVEEFLDDAASRIAVDLKDILEQVRLPKAIDLGKLEEQNLPRRILRLGIQLIWGSEGEMARDIAAQLLELLPSEPGEAVSRAAEVLCWALDYRLSDGHTGIVLSMGRDSIPGALSLAESGELAIGGAITGSPSGATGVVMSSSLSSGSWAAHDAAGVLILANRCDSFGENDLLLMGSRRIGVFKSEGAISTQPTLEGDALDERTKDPDALRRAAADLPLSAVFFESATTAGRDGASMRPAALRAELPDAPDASERKIQELMMRDIGALAWSGELRTNPLKAFLNRRITVHSQGGIPMAANKDQGPTGWDGQVFGCEGLYVMDAAAFPNSVGVNPSATIAAVAEYKVQDFVRRRLEQGNWEAPELRAALAWASERRDELDPIKKLKGQSDPPDSQPIGIEFREIMTGWHQPDDGERALIETELEASIPDLAAYLQYHHRGQSQQIRVSGKLKAESLPGVDGSQTVLPDESYMQLFVEQPLSPEGAEVRTINYHLVMETPLGRCVLEGIKTIRDDDRPDVWEDTTTLSFAICRDGESSPFTKGVLRVPAAKFFGVQLPSFRATNTQDPARQSWALLTFGGFFFSHLIDIYVPEFGRAIDVLKGIAEQSHV